MSVPAASNFKRPPTVQCIATRYCLGFGRKVHNPNRICSDCLKRHDPQQLRIWANNNSTALSVIEEQVNRKQEQKNNIEARDRFLCAFEDPDFQNCPWRVRSLNLRGTRLNCTTVRRKGRACERCWSRHLLKIGILQYFTPTGLCREEADKLVTRPTDSGGEVTPGEDDVEGYNIVFD